MARATQIPPLQHASPTSNAVIGGLERVLAKMAESREGHDWETHAHPTFKESVGNLLDYLSLRDCDLRELQASLARLGLSSLGRAEAHARASVTATLNAARAVFSENRKDERAPSPSFERADDLLREHTETLLGSPPQNRSTHIMVTMSADVTQNDELMRNLLRNGMTCMRINCAHDDATVWASMIEQLRRAEADTGRTCRVLMDLAGPKLRTAGLAVRAGVIKIQPHRDEYGRVQEPAFIWLTPDDKPTSPPRKCGVSLQLPRPWLKRLARGDTVRLHDARGSRRKWKVVHVWSKGCIVETSKTNYLISKTRLEHTKTRARDRYTFIDQVPQHESFVVLRPKDTLLLASDPSLSRPAQLSASGRVLTPPTIACTLPSVLQDIEGGQPIWFDDGKIGGVVERSDGHIATVRITHAKPSGTKLRSDKGINLPNTRIRASALTDKDLADLDFAAHHADMVGLSFVRSPEDVHSLQQALERASTRSVAIVLKIETHQAFERAPELLMAAMRRESCGVMIARGDLAVECGFERMAEVQEELLWVCEAAHVPVIWATQVLDTLAKSGRASRGEMTDAAMANRAECVMLNKGPHILEAVTSLADVLSRMQGHQRKKSAQLRPLHLASAFFGAHGSAT